MSCFASFRSVFTSGFAALSIKLRLIAALQRAPATRRAALVPSLPQLTVSQSLARRLTTDYLGSGALASARTSVAATPRARTKKGQRLPAFNSCLFVGKSRAIESSVSLPQAFASLPLASATHNSWTHNSQLLLQYHLLGGVILTAGHLILIHTGRDGFAGAVASIPVDLIIPGGSMALAEAAH